MKPIIKSCLAVSSLSALAATLTTLAPGAAYAQDAQASDSGLADIVVTASRRETSLQKESRVVSVVDATMLERAAVVDPTTVQNLVAGVNVTPNGQQMQVYIRGVGDQTINATTDPAVAVNVDGVYYPRAYEATTQFFDLERVEVLKGPQGTLYGRNASAGAMNLISARPKFKTEGFAEFEYGNYDSIRGTGAINLPFSDKMALRVAGQVIRRDGYLSDGYNDAESEALRASLLLDAGEGTSLLITGSYAHQGGKGNASVLLPDFSGTLPSAVPLPSNPWAGPTDPATVARIEYTNPTNSRHIVDPALGWVLNGFVDADIYSLVMDFEHQFEGATLTVMPSYVGSHFKNWNASAVAVPTYDDTISDQFGIETRLSSPAGSRHKWVIGAMAMHEDASSNYQSWIPIPPGSLLQMTEAPHRDDTTLGIFGEANIALSDQFRVIVGGRYTREKKIVDGSTDAIVGPFGLLGAPFAGLPPFDIGGLVISSPTALDISGKRTDKAFNYRAGVEYDLTPTSMFYATIASGFKAGGFYNDVAGANSYKPEKLTAYTAGIKNRFLDNRLQLNIEGYYWDYKDKQETYVGPLSINPLSVLLITANAASAEIYGLELSGILKLSDNDVLSGDLSYTHARYGRFVIPLLGGGTANSTGKPLMRAPEWSGRVSYEHTQPLGSMGELILNASMRFSSDYWLNNTYLPVALHPSYQVFDAALTWQSESERFSVTGFVKNITDKAYYTGAIFPPATLDGLGQIAAPRTYGARVRMKF
ncbi:MAG: TonB-dependent receptor [Sphingobium sp.]|nr:TonB-dependent receptor [Sphingobium sp.]MBP8670380.1 TonB-dependent receptor [Sphingobium sp.]MBP9157510.1 TonB-dependent receptor [Sphingobium sp.]